MGLLRDDPLGSKSIDAVKPSDAKEWAIRMREGTLLFPADHPIQRGTPQGGKRSGEKRIKGF